MPASRKSIDLELEALLQPGSFNDYCPNGLQVQGKDEISLIVSGVTACQELIEQAIDVGADMVLVHHGYFWRGEDPAITGIKHHRVKRLLAHDINLFAYHLPLDVHPELGNNAQFGALLGLEPTGEFALYQGRCVGLVGRLREPCTTASLSERIASRLGRKPLTIDGVKGEISTVAWCTGAAQGYIGEAVAAGADAYITGEVSEPTVHIAREAGIAFFSAGHHATERYGVKALGNYLAQKFSLEHRFIDIDNPV